ncbi:MAG: hypothetical protein ACOH5I_25735 [Oligoflexus sp.]
MSFEIVDNKSQTTRIEYDQLGRVIKNTSGVDQRDRHEEIYTWDMSSNGKGLLHKAGTATYAEEYSYDKLSRLIGTQFAAEGKRVSIQQDYDEYSAGAKLDNTEMKRTLKLVVLGRKNIRFFKTEAGAAIADVIMSLAATAYKAEINAFDYFTDIQRYHKLVKEDPMAWVTLVISDGYRVPKSEKGNH